MLTKNFQAIPEKSKDRKFIPLSPRSGKRDHGFVTLTTSAAGHGLHPAFSKQEMTGSPSLGNRANRLYPNYYISNKKCEAIK